MMRQILLVLTVGALGCGVVAKTNEVADLGTVLVEGRALSKYRPERVSGGTFTDEATGTYPSRMPWAIA